MTEPEAFASGFLLYHIEISLNFFALSKTLANTKSVL